MSEKLESKRLVDFLNNYDYSFWYHKIFSTDEMYEDESFINKVLGKMKGGNVEEIRRSLALEMFMTSQHLIETLFMLIGAFTYAPRDPYSWINDRKNYGSKISELIRNDDFETLLKTLRLETIDDYIRYLFLEIPVLPEFKAKLDDQIEPAKTCLKLLAVELLKNEDLYNAYKHGFIAHRGIAKISYHKPSKQMILESPKVPTIWTPPKKHKLAVVVEVENESKQFDVDNLYFTKLDYERQREISKFALFLIRDIVESRRVLLHKRDRFELEALPTAEEIKKIFGFDEK